MGIKKSYVLLLAIAVAVFLNFTVFKDTPEKAALKAKIEEVEERKKAARKLYKANYISARLLYLMGEDGNVFFCGEWSMGGVDACLFRLQQFTDVETPRDGGLADYPVRSADLAWNEFYWEIWDKEAQNHPQKRFKERYPAILAEVQKERKVAYNEAKIVYAELNNLEEQLDAL